MTDSLVIPQHVGIILDGNRRWANENHVSTLEGHRSGSENFKIIAHEAFNRGVKYLSAFIFSVDNWTRTEEEVGYLMQLVIKAFEQYLDEFHKDGIRIVVLGRRNGLRRKVLEVIKKTEEKTKNNTAGTLALCFNYGGQEEIVDAIKEIVSEQLHEGQITKQVLNDHLYSPDIPPIDLLIRTSGEHRTSGFMLSRADYAELYFSDKLWPNFTNDDLNEAFNSYQKRERRFGS
ncbi:MAG: isoprenyl transferase [Candidatus Saccharimonadales bacterium]